MAWFPAWPHSTYYHLVHSDGIDESCKVQVVLNQIEG